MTAGCILKECLPQYSTQQQIFMIAHRTLLQAAHCWVSSDPMGVNDSDSAVLKISACSSLWMSADAVAAVHAGNVSSEQSVQGAAVEMQHLKDLLAQAEQHLQQWGSTARCGFFTGCRSSSR